METKNSNLFQALDNLLFFVSIKGFPPLWKTFVIKSTIGVDASFAYPVFVKVQTEIHQKLLPAGVEVQVDEEAEVLCFSNRGAHPARSVGPSMEASQSSPPLGAEQAAYDFLWFLFTCFFAAAGGEATVGVVGLML